MARHQICVPVWLLAGAWLPLEGRADEWLGRDKAAHLVGTAALSTVVSVGSQRPEVGFWTGVAAGAAKEVWDGRQAGRQASAKDFVWSVAGAYVGSQGGGWILKRSGGQTVLAYSWTF